MDLYPILSAYDKVQEAEHALRALDDLLSSSTDDEFNRLAYLTSPILNTLRKAIQALEPALPNPSCKTKKEK